MHRARHMLRHVLWLALGCFTTQACIADGLHAVAVERALSVTAEQLQKLVRGERVIPAWRKDGAQFWFAADGADGVEYRFVDPDARRVRPLFDHARLEAAIHAATGHAGLGEIRNPDFDFDSQELSFELDKRHWIYSTATDRLAEKPKEAGAVSPDRRWRVLVRDHNLFLEEVATGKLQPLTTDGTALRPYARPVVNLKDMVEQGTSDPEIAPDVVWSPDSRRFVTYQMNLQGARRLSAVQSAPPGGGSPRVFDYVYPMAGDARVPTAQTLIVTVATGTVIRVAAPVQDLLYYGGPGYEWTRDSGAILQSVADRSYTALRLYSIDPASGRSVVLTSDESARLVDLYAHRWTYLPASDSVVWMSADAGWNHAFRINRRGVRERLTSGAWTVADMPGGDGGGKAVFVIGRGREAGRDPYLRHLYRVDDGGRKISLLTPEPFDHEVYVSPDGRYFIDNMSLVDRPTITRLRSARDGTVVMNLQEADASELRRIGLSFPEAFTATAADGRTPLYGVLYKPSGFDPARRYPVVEYIYTGPHTITAPKSFADSLLRVDAGYAVAELGFVVVIVDGRGTSGRGKAFLAPAIGRLHSVGLDDHIAAIRELAARRPYMDISSVGVYGFSAGGYDVVRAMTERPDFYKVGVSASGNHDNRLDKAVWNEQWLGSDPSAGYDENSNVTWAPKLQGALLLAHGELDENVPPAATLRLVDALVRAEKPFELLIVPNADHFLFNVPYYNRARFEFLLRKLSPPPPPP